MITQAYLTEWGTGAPWPTAAQIEQDLILSRLIVEIAHHPLLSRELRLRGGTCLHKLRALYQRRKGRDLFDLWVALDALDIDDRVVVDGLGHYMRGAVYSYPELQRNIEQKVGDRVFLEDHFRADALPTALKSEIRSSITSSSGSVVASFCTAPSSVAGRG